MTDPPDQRALALRCKLFESRVTRFAIRTCHSNFNELMVMQSTLCLSHDARANPGVANQDDGFERVGEAAQVAALFFC